MSIDTIYADKFVSITELKRSPAQLIAMKEAVAIFRNNKAEAYLVPSDLYQELMEKLELLEDLELAAIAESRQGQKSVAVSLDDL
jgi:antitoxin StbD